MLRLLLLATFFLTFSFQTNARFRIAPVAAVTGGFWEYQRSQGSQLENYLGQYTGTGAGLRLYNHYRYWFWGFDFNIYKISWEYNYDQSSSIDDTFLAKVDATMQEGAFVVGVSTLGDGVRLWLTGVFHQKLRFSENFDPALPRQTFEGNSYGIGISFESFWGSQINIKAIRTVYRTLKEQEETKRLPADVNGVEHSKLEHDSLTVFLSFPLWGKGKK